jgi:hypothetical protein
VIPGDKDACSITNCKTGSNREAAAEALRECHHIRFDAAMLPAPKRSRPPNTSLYLIENQERIVRIRKSPCVDKIGIVCDVYPAFTLNGLEEDCGRVLIYSGCQCITVIEWNVDRSSRQRAKGF